MILIESDKHYHSGKLSLTYCVSPGRGPSLCSKKFNTSRVKLLSVYGICYCFQVTASKPRLKMVGPCYKTTIKMYTSIPTPSNSDSTNFTQILCCLFSVLSEGITKVAMFHLPQFVTECSVRGGYVLTHLTAELLLLPFLLT